MALQWKTQSAACMAVMEISSIMQISLINSDACFCNFLYGGDLGSISAKSNNLMSMSMFIIYIYKI